MMLWHNYIFDYLFQFLIMDSLVIRSVLKISQQLFILGDVKNEATKFIRSVTNNLVVLRKPAIRDNIVLLEISLSIF